jgi:serralysin
MREALMKFMASGLAVALVAGVGACVTAETEITSTANGPTWEEFEATVYREPWEGGVYIVDGDVPVASREELRALYDRVYGEGALAVNVVGGQDDRWSDSAKLNLTYCVSRSSFGGNYDRVVAAMNEAAAAWELATSVDFVHVAQLDGDCTASQANVVFDVRQVSGQRYLARAFFPSSARGARNVLIDSGAIGGRGPWSLAGILRHELGHTLGFRHEHIRQAGSGCGEPGSWRDLTPYDSASVMHYPQCSGTNTGDLVLTDRDILGAVAIYGARGQSQYALRSSTGHYLVAEGGGGSNAQANRTAIGPWERFTMVPLAGGKVAFRATNGHYMVAEGGGGGVLNVNRGLIGPWEQFTIQDAGGGTIALRTHSGHYVVAEGGGGGAANANRTAIGPWERFGLIRVGGDKVVLRTHNGHYVVAEHGGGDTLHANRTAIGPWEQFSLLDAGDGTIALRAHAGHYVVAEDGGGGAANANRTAIGPWERFRIVPL